MAERARIALLLVATLVTTWAHAETYTCAYETTRNADLFKIEIVANGTMAILKRGERYRPLEYIVLRNDDVGLVLVAGDALEMDPNILEVDYLVLRKPSSSGDSEFGSNSGESISGSVSINGHVVTNKCVCKSL